LLGLREKLTFAVKHESTILELLLADTESFLFLGSISHRDYISSSVWHVLGLVRMKIKSPAAARARLEAASALVGKAGLTRAFIVVLRVRIDLILDTANINRNLLIGD
jgi:hypothetical protein